MVRVGGYVEKAVAERTKRGTGFWGDGTFRVLSWRFPVYRRDCQNSSRFTLPTDVAHHMKIVLQLVDREVKSRCWVRNLAWASEPVCPTGSHGLQTAGFQTVLSRGRLSNPSLHLCRLQETNWLSLLWRKKNYFSRNSLLTCLLTPTCYKVLMWVTPWRHPGSRTPRGICAVAGEC